MVRGYERNVFYIERSFAMDITSLMSAVEDEFLR